MYSFQKKVLMVSILFFALIGITFAGTVGDVNGDGYVGLEEAIHALQVVAGVRSLCDGTWNKTSDGEPSESGVFTFQYSLKDGGASGQITFTDFFGPDYNWQLMVISDDGIDFVPYPEVYGDNPPDLNLTISGGSVSGTLVYNVCHHGEPAEDPDCWTYTAVLNGSCD